MIRLSVMRWIVLTLAVGGAIAEEAQVALKKDLIVYSSFSGNTEIVAKTLAEMLKADLLKLEDEKPISRDEAYGAGREASLQGKSWPLKAFNVDLSGYNRIFVGCPVWFGMPTPQFNAFVEQVNLAGKQVVVFVTLGGGNPEKALKAMTEKVEAKGAKVVSSFSIKTRGVTKEDLAAKAKEAGQKYLPEGARE
ncbi:MAG: hypothetical protein N2255_09245 [Kiritimatiellae bacterium]|nr:hypothetical protein [Kiritimatiellia bacterium]